MRKKNLFLVYAIGIFAFSVTSIFAQTRIPTSSLLLMKAGDVTQGVKLGESIGKAVQILGQPTSISDEYWEIDSVLVKIYNYKGNFLYFTNDVLSGFELKDSSIQVGSIGGITFKVKDRITIKIKKTNRRPGLSPIIKRKKTFFDFSLVERDGKSRGIEYSAISVNYLSDAAANLDSRLELLFNSNDQLINISVSE
jgi:hypothetical protein